ncbi:long-chain-fatty-acid--CoA ligase 5 [Trichonephila clavipes]|nr:long-chain-fatty-acid--CoA ligase 5 [Trichonephila clavipes]
MITNFFIPELNNHDVQELWFQQDGATCHTARATINLFKDTCGDRLISRFGSVNWPPRSWDLTPLDYFLWGYVKSSKIRRPDWTTFEPAEIRKNFLLELRKIGTQKELNSLEQARNLAFLSEPFSVDNELMSPTLKVRRGHARKRYGDLILSLYKEGPLV